MASFSFEGNNALRSDWSHSDRYGKRLHLPVFNNMDVDFQSQVLTAPVFFSGVNEELRKFSVDFGNSCLHCRADHLVTVDQYVCLSQIKQQARKEF